MFTRTATVKNAMGIHCRPSAVIVKELRDCPCDVTFTANGGECDPKSILGLLAMGLAPGDEVSIRVSGEDESRWGLLAVDLIERVYDFPPRDEE